MPGYIKQQILDDVELKEARDLAASLDFYKVYQMYNLFDLERADIQSHESYGFCKTLQEYSKLPQVIGLYFLRYIPNSFTRMHEDNNTDMTIVTLLEDQDLVGGHAIVQDTYAQKDRPSNQICNRGRHEIEKPPYGKKIITDVLPMKRGESLIYGKDLTHGVSKVYEGSRLVLVSWFKRDSEG